MTPSRGRGDVATGEEVRRGERFLAAYTVIEQAMRRRWGDPAGRESFRRMVDLLDDKDWVVRQFRDDLAEFAELRNAIVHERVNPSYLIAVPLPETVDKIERIAAAMDSPPLVYPRFRRDVARFSPEDRMANVFAKVSETGYSQFPVYDGSVYQGLLTDSGIARWVASRLTRKSVQAGVGGQLPRGLAAPGLQQLMDVPVRDVLLSEKTPDRARFVSQRATVYEAEDLFRNPGRREKWRVAAVLITLNGSPEEPLSGIITPSDVVAMAE